MKTGDCSHRRNGCAAKLPLQPEFQVAFQIIPFARVWAVARCPDYWAVPGRGRRIVEREIRLVHQDRDAAAVVRS